MDGKCKARHKTETCELTNILTPALNFPRLGLEVCERAQDCRRKESINSRISENNDTNPREDFYDADNEEESPRFDGETPFQVSETSLRSGNFSMDIPGGEEEVISMPISTSFPAISDSSRLRLLAAASTPEGKPPEKGLEGRKAVRYRECQKNHAANLGGLVTDGCGEFMPGGEEGTPEALRCAACECHRNFHRREVEGEEAQIACDVCYHKRLVPGSTLLPLSFPQAAMGVLARPLPQIIAAAPVNNNMKNSAVFVPSPESEEQADGNLPSGKKRFRTKFTHEQKERMLAFAQRVGWRLQKHEEAAVQSFCQEVGVRRHVLKVWMHNNKHAMATKPHADDNNHNNDNTAAANSSSNNSTP